MVKITPDNTDTQIVDNTSASRGYREFGFGSLFEGASQIAGTVVKALDDRNQRELKEEVRDSAETIRDFATYRAANDVGVMETIPQALRGDLKRMQKVKDVAEQGRYRPSQYYSLLDVEAKRIRNRYPGYKEFVDKAFADITGVNPANAVLNSLFQESRALAAGRADKQSEADKQWDWLQKNRQYMSPEMEHLFSNTPPDKRTDALVNAAYGNIAKNKRERQQLQDKSATLALSDAQDKATIRDTKRVFYELAYRDMNEAAQKAIIREYGSMENFELVRRKGSAGPEDDAKLLTISRELDALVENVVSQRMSSPMDQGAPPGKTVLFSSRIADSRAEIVKNLRDSLSPVLRALNDKDYGAVGAMLRAFGDQSKYDAKILVDRSEQLRMYNAMSAMNPEVAKILYANRPAEIWSEAQRVASGGFSAQNISNDPEKVRAAGTVIGAGLIRGDGAIGQLNKTSRRGENISDIVSPTLRAMNELLKNPKISDEQKDKLLMSYDPKELPELFNSVAAGKRQQLYQMLANSPGFVARYKLLQKEGKTELFNRITNAMDTSFASAAKAGFDAISDLRKSDTNVDVVWNENTKQWDVIPGPANRDGAIQMPPEIAELNRTIAAHTPFVEARGGAVEKEMYNLMQGLGLNNRDAATYEGSMWSQFKDWVTSKFGNTGSFATHSKIRRIQDLVAIRPGLLKENDKTRFDKINQVFSDNLFRMFNDMPAHLRAALRIDEGWRSNDYQAMLAQRNAGTGRKTAPAGRSRHELGAAIDISPINGWDSDPKSEANRKYREAMEWIRNPRNLQRYGLRTISNDYGHIELDISRAEAERMARDEGIDFRSGEPPRPESPAQQRFASETGQPPVGNLGGTTDTLSPDQSYLSAPDAPVGNLMGTTDSNVPVDQVTGTTISRIPGAPVGNLEGTAVGSPEQTVSTLPVAPRGNLEGTTVGGPTQEVSTLPEAPRGNLEGTAVGSPEPQPVKYREYNVTEQSNPDRAGNVDSKIVRTLAKQILGSAVGVGAADQPLVNELATLDSVVKIGRGILNNPQAVEEKQGLNTIAMVTEMFRAMPEDWASTIRVDSIDGGNFLVRKAPKADDRKYAQGTSWIYLNDEQYGFRYDGKQLKRIESGPNLDAILKGRK